MQMIRQGVQLRSVGHSHRSRNPSTSKHVDQLETVLKRMKEKINPSDDEDSGETDTFEDTIH